MNAVGSSRFLEWLMRVNDEITAEYSDDVESRCRKWNRSSHRRIISTICHFSAHGFDGMKDEKCTVDGKATCYHIADKRMSSTTTEVLTTLADADCKLLQQCSRK